MRTRHREEGRGDGRGRSVQHGKKLVGGPGSGERFVQLTHPYRPGTLDPSRLSRARSIHDCDTGPLHCIGPLVQLSSRDEHGASVRPVNPLIIGVAGGSGSGKSTVARNVAAALGDASVAFIDMDAYYLDHSRLSLEERRKVNWDHPNAFDWELLTEQLSHLANGSAIDKPVYDFVEHARSQETVRI